LKKRTSKSRSDSDIAELILRDHKPIKKLIPILKDSKGSVAKKQAAFAEFERILSAHAQAEQESLYAELKNVEDLKSEGIEGDTEHAIATQLMTEANDNEMDEDTWMAKVKVLAELVEHHIKEEEGQLLKSVRKEFNLDERETIGERYTELLHQLEERMGAA
jgi:hypothetical protein